MSSDDRSRRLAFLRDLAAEEFLGVIRDVVGEVASTKATDNIDHLRAVGGDAFIALMTARAPQIYDLLIEHDDLADELYGDD